MNLFNKILLIFLSPFFAITLFAKDFSIELTFDNFFLESQKIFVQDLNQISSRNDLENLIKAQDWIDEYKINFKPFTKSAKLTISSRKPYFILNNNYFIDQNLKKFRFDETQLDLILVEGPINDLRLPMSIINFFEIKAFNQLIIKRIIYTYVAGWEVHTNSFKIKIGKNITDQKLKSLEDTLNYLYENRKIPSMIDLRNKDGVALSYGK